MKKSLKNMDLCLISQLVLSVLIMILGIIVMVFKSFGLTDITLYVSILFFILAFISTIMYFIRRREGDYEILLYALINILTATFLFVFKDDNVCMILGVSMLVYTVLFTSNRCCKIMMLKKRSNFMWIIKSIATFLIVLLGMLTSYNLFKEVTVQTMMYSFYFTSLGVILTLENLVEMFITDETFDYLLNKLLNDEPKRDLEEIEIVDLSSPKKEEVKEQKKTTTSTKKNNNKKTTEKKKTTTNQKSSNNKKVTTKKTTSKKQSQTSNAKKTVKKVGRPKKENK